MKPLPLTEAQWQQIVSMAHDFLQRLPQHPTNNAQVLSQVSHWQEDLPDGLSDHDRADHDSWQMTLNHLQQHLLPHVSGAPGPRYWGFVTGGSNPAALAGDWLVSVLDQNPAVAGDSVATLLTEQTLHWCCDLFALPHSFQGTLTTGATTANLLGVATARQWLGQQQGIDIAQQGQADVSLDIFAATPHASTIKVLGLLGLGQQNWTAVACLPHSEQMDTMDLAERLQASTATGKLIIASAGTVTGTDFDDLETIATLAQAHQAWVHVDGAFGLFSRLLNDKASWTQGIERVDSITVDAHKWLNVPYESGIFFTRHRNTLRQTCGVQAAYLSGEDQLPSYMHLGVENSQRFRALPIWMTLQTYGKKGVASWVKANCQQAQQLGHWLDEHVGYQLLVSVKLNVVVFAVAQDDDGYLTAQRLQHINQSGVVFMTPGSWQGKTAIRAAFSNWQTTTDDVEKVQILLHELATSAHQK